MPPKANKPAAPKKPTKPSAKSKTGNTACSQAASNWQLSIRGKEPLDPQTYATLAKCRAMTRTAKQADDRARMGYNLNEQGAAALKGRLQKRFDQGLITQKSRDERLKTLLQQRKEKQAAVAAKPVTQTVEKLTGTKAVAQRFENAENKFIEHAISHAGLTRPQAVTALNAMTKAKAVKIDPIIGQFSFTHGAFGDKAVIRKAAGIEPAKPTDKAASLVSSVRQKPGYGVAREAAKINKVNARFLNYNRNQEYQDYIEKQNPTLEAKRLMGEASELRRKAAEFNKSTDYSATKNKGKVETQSYSSGKGTRIVGFTENATSNIHRKMLEEAKQKLTRAKELEKQPAKPVVTRKEFNREYGKTNKGTVTTQPAFTLKQSSSQGGTGAGRSMGVLFQTEGTALDKAAKAGQKTPLAGQAGLFEKKPAFSRQGQLAPGRGTEQRRARAQYLSGIRKNDPEMVVEAANRRFQLDNSKIKWSVTRSDDGQVSIGKALAPTNFQVYRDIAKQSIRKKLDKSRIAQPPQPKPFSRGGQLAPGRGTPERNEMALMLRGARNTLKSLKDIGKKRLTESGRKGLITKASKQLSQLRSLARYGTNWANIKSYD